MPKTFDAGQEAEKIGTMVRNILESDQKKDDRPIEYNPIFEKQRAELSNELTTLWQNPEQMRAVGMVFEEKNEKLFSLFPPVEISANKQGVVESLDFRAAKLDMGASYSHIYSTRDKPVALSSDPQLPDPDGSEL